MTPSAAPSRVFQHPDLAADHWRLRRRITGRHTRLCEYESAGDDPRRVFVKRFRAPAGGGVDRRLVREFRALRVLQRALGPEAGRSLPAPVALLRAEHCLVLGAVPGVPLATVLKRDANRLVGVLRLRSLRRTGAAVGRWLERFQGLTARGAVPHDHDRFHRDLEVDLGKLPGGADATELRAAVARVLEASRGLDGHRLPAAGRHSDFLPQNILIGSEHVGAVDFENYRLRDAVHRDPGSLLAYLGLLERRRAYLPWALRTFVDGFIDGYGLRCTGPVQDLFTAAAAVRIARDSGDPEVARHLARTLSDLSPRLVHRRAGIRP